MTSTDLTIPFDTTLSPGIYGLIFGTGLFGATTSSGGMPRFEPVSGSTGFFWSDQPFRWSNDGSNTHKIFLEANAIPEPSAYALFVVMILGILVLKT